MSGHYTKKFGLISSRTPTDVPRAERVVAGRKYEARFKIAAETAKLKK